MSFTDRYCWTFFHNSAKFNTKVFPNCLHRLVPCCRLHIPLEDCRCITSFPSFPNQIFLKAFHHNKTRPGPTCSEGQQDVLRLVLGPEHRQLPLIVPQPEPHILLRLHEVQLAVQPGVPRHTAPVVDVLHLPHLEMGEHVAVEHGGVPQPGDGVPEQETVVLSGSCLLSPPGTDLDIDCSGVIGNIDTAAVSSQRD